MGRTVCRRGPFARGERIALYLDLENLLYGEGIHRLEVFTALVGLLRGFGARGIVVAAIACCDCTLARELAFAFEPAGVRIFTHDGGPDAADNALIERIRHELPASVRTVVIGSGDHIFAAVADELRARGLRVEVIARQGSLSAELYTQADDAHVISLS